nr:immunoglobulin heavy chain junction region [Macaca mulatta]MOX93020.1 immunoglobulin heavy chain junction region [Macaca mulatta]
CARYEAGGTKVDSW